MKNPLRDDKVSAIKPEWPLVMHGIIDRAFTSSVIRTWQQSHPWASSVWLFAVEGFLLIDTVYKPSLWKSIRVCDADLKRNYCICHQERRQEVERRVRAPQILGGNYWAYEQNLSWTRKADFLFGLTIAIHEIIFLVARLFATYLATSIILLICPTGIAFPEYLQVTYTAKTLRK